jgi:DNA-binding FadR family transcriptional regulator
MAVSSASSSPAPEPKTGETLARQLRNQIARGELAIGDRLPPEDELMEHFGVARTSLREGLRILESQGLIRVIRGRKGGPQVTAPPIDRLAQSFALRVQLQGATLADLDEARALIERFLVGRLAETRTDEDLAALDEAIGHASDAADRVDRDAFALAATEVHETIAARAGNITLATVAAMLHELALQYYQRGAAHADRAMMQRAVRSYRKLHRLIEAGDADAAIDHWGKQLLFTITRLEARERLDLFDKTRGGIGPV